jgi:hypothetical protein
MTHQPLRDSKSRGSQSLPPIEIVDPRRSYEVIRDPRRRIHSIWPRRPKTRKQSFITWGSAPDPGIFAGIALAFDETTKQQCPGPYQRTGASTERHRRAIDLVIPRRVASPQSPTPFHQTNDTMPSSTEERKTYRDKKLC